MKRNINTNKTTDLDCRVGCEDGYDGYDGRRG
jgi:hypothetical protein